MYKIAVIGDRDSIYGFATLGLDVYPADDEQTGRTLFRRIVEGEYAVAYITEKLAAELADEIEKLRFMAPARRDSDPRRVRQHRLGDPERQEFCGEGGRKRYYIRRAIAGRSGRAGRAEPVRAKR